MNKTITSTFIILLCSIGLTACNAAHSRHHNNTAAALVVGVGVGALLHGHSGYRHSHRNVRGHSHGRPHKGRAYHRPVSHSRPRKGCHQSRKGCSRPHKGNRGKGRNKGRH